MFKQATIYHTGLHAISLEILESELQRRPFTPCLATQELSVGWVPPRGEANAAMVEIISGWLVMTLEIETKKVPPAAVKKGVEELALWSEQAEGRKPSKKRLKELKDQAILNLLPHAFPRRKRINIAANSDGLTIIGSTSASALDIATREIVTALADVQIAPVNTVTAPAALMAEMLYVDRPGAMAAGNACELKSADETKATVRYANHSLDIEEIFGHLDAGKTVTKLEILSGDTLTFVLTDALQLKSIKIDDAVVLEENERDDSFTANAFLALNTLGQAINNLIEAMGGEIKTEQRA